jgi:type II restriction enzyme
MKRDFNKWLATFKDNIATYNYYTDFQKVYKNVEDIRIELNILNSLIGSKNIESDFMNLVVRYPEILNAIPILLAKRESEIKITESGTDLLYIFNKTINEMDNYIKFMRETGLFDLLQNHLINNLIDYVIGVEVGMDTNCRKNRTGRAMEDLVESYLLSKGLTKGNTYFKEMTKSEIERKFGINLDKISNKGKTEKRFDFVVLNRGVVYAIEANFYSGGGSKLNETARSYKQLALELKDVPNFKFVWITDGVGWNSARKNLEETYDILENMANLMDLNNDIFKEYFSKENE